MDPATALPGAATPTVPESVQAWPAPRPADATVVRNPLSLSAANSAGPTPGAVVVVDKPTPAQAVAVAVAPTAPRCTRAAALGWCMWYLGKWMGDPSKKSPTCPTPFNIRTWRIFPGVLWTDVMWSSIGTMLGILAVSSLHYQVLTQLSLAGLVASFGASAVLVYAAPAAPLSQPRNLVLGHMVSAFCGVSVRMAWPCVDGEYTDICTWGAPSLAVTLAIIAMQATGSLHPPGGATSLIAVVGDASVRRLGFMYCVLPVGSGALLMLIVALAINNIPKNRRYPQYWI